MTFRGLSAGPYLGALGATVRRDGMVKAAILFFLAGAIVSAALGAVQVPPEARLAAWFQSRFDNLGELTLLALVVLGLVRGSGEISGREERSFWRRMAFAHCGWLAGAALHLVPELPAELPKRPLQVVFYAVLYIFILRAVEGEPHRPAGTRKSAEDRLLTWPAVTFFVLGLVVYFVFIPVSVEWRALLAGSLDEGTLRRDEFYLYALLDVYLSLRFLFLARTAPTRRWRSIYLALALPWLVVLLVADLSVIAWDTPLVWPLEWIPRWWMCAPFVFQLLAVRLRHHPFPGGWQPSESESDESVESPLGSPGELPLSDRLSFVVSTRTVALGVVFPVIHIVATRLELVGASGHGARQVVVLVWLLFFGGIALLQHRRLERRAQELWHDRVRFEEALRSSEKDLRLIIERDRATEMVRSAEQKFDLLFRSCPYTLAVTRLADRRFIEVNPGFAETFGHPRDEVIGRTVEEVGLWLDPDAGARLFERVSANRPVREVEIPFRRRDGDERAALVSAAGIRAGGEACMLWIVHDATERRRAETRLEGAADLLDQANAAIVEIDVAGKIRSWNRGALDLSGWPVDEAVGRPARDLLGPPAAVDAALAAGSAEWTGRLELKLRDGGASEVLGWCTPVAGPEGGKLLIGARIS